MNTQVSELSYALAPERVTSRARRHQPRQRRRAL